jgi:hypothetical protein
MPRPRGRPPKYGSPSKIIAVTLPEDVVQDLEQLHDDLGWAIVRLVEQRRKESRPKKPVTTGRKATRAARVAAAELVGVGTGMSLIVVNSAAVRSIPGVQMIPLSESEAFLALEPGKGMSDLELAVHDRLEHVRATSRERAALERLLTQLRRWRRDSHRAFHSRAIVLVSGGDE